MKQWRLTWGEHSFTAADLTGRHLVLVGLGMGDDEWHAPEGPRRLLAILAACLCLAEGRDLLTVTEELAGAKALDLAAALSFDDE